MTHRLTIYLTFILLFGLIGFSATVKAAPGDLDTTFSQDGKLVETLLANSSDRGQATAVQADGKIVIAGTLTVGGRSGCGVARYNPDGSPDTAFDGDGKTAGLNGTTFSCRAVALQADGKIVVAGSVGSGAASDFGLMRFNSDGSPDPTFGVNGKVTTAVGSGSYDVANAVAIQTDGKIVAAGVTNPGSASNFGLVRYNPNGSLDTSFDGDGKVITDFSVSIDVAYAVAIQADGKIVAAGYSFYTSNDDFALVRYNSNGSLDTTFDGDGKVTTDISGSSRGDQVNALAIQADGKIVAAGYSITLHGAFSSPKFALARYNPDGSLDSTFEGDGIVVNTVLGNSDFITAVAIHTDGKIVAAGYGYSGASPDFALARYNADGSLDTSFDGDGTVITPLSIASDAAYGLALQTDGKVIAVGYSRSGANDVVALLRYNTDGSPDPTFDGDGQVITGLGLPTASGAGKAAVQADGKIVVAGYMFNGLNDDFALVRYNPDGSRDLTFGSGGLVTTDITGNVWGDRANAVAIQPDGKIIAAGGGHSGVTNDFIVIRYNADGSLDTSFDGDGKVITDFSNSSDGLSGVAIQANGKIIAAGTTFPGSNNDAALIRYNADGSLDGSFGIGGKVKFDLLGGSNDFIKGMVLDAAGRAVIVGESNNNISIARVLINDAPPNRAPFDFDGDHRTDVSVFRPLTGEWWIYKSSNGGNFVNAFGNSTDKLVPADYTGDGKADVAFFRPSSGEWFILRSDDGSYYSIPFGASGDVPVPADYDGDGRADPAVFRPSTGVWYINRSSGGTLIQTFGQSGDEPIAADYDGDGKADIAIWRASAGEWWIQRSSAGLIAFAFGNGSDKPVPGDYTGDGRADAAVWRPSTGEWFILRSENSSYYSLPFGTSTDIPVPGDYDGDGKFDPAVFRPSTSTWYAQRTTAGILIQSFGALGDRPVPNAFVP
jgi:uncharacterized delta-60 repeat protein